MDKDVSQQELIRLTQEKLKLRKQAEILREVGRILNSSLNPKDVLDLILDQLDRIVEYDSASIMQLSGNQLAIIAHRKLRSPDQLMIPFDISIHAHLREVIEKRVPLIIGDTQGDSRWQTLPSIDYIRCWMGVPLIGKDQVIGLLNLDRETPGCYTAEDAEITAMIANHAAIAIENARLYSAERQRVSQLDALHATIADISAEHELPKLLKAILERAVHLLDASGGDLGLVSEDNQEIIIVVSHNMGANDQVTHLTIGEGAIGKAVSDRQPVIVDEYNEWESSSPQYRDGHFHSVLAVPFLIGSKVLGAIGIVDENPERRFTQEDQSLLNSFAQHAAIAVENANLYQSARQSAERRAILHRVSQEIVSANLDPEEIYTAIHQAAAQIMPVEAFVITQFDEKKQLIQAVYLIDRSGRTPPQTASPNRGLSGRILASGQPIYIEDTLDTSQLGDAIHFGDPAQVRSVLAVPMRLRGKVKGMISAQSYAPGAYTAEDQNLLEMLASYAAIALDNAALFQNIQKMAITDELTGIYNRRYLFEVGRSELHRARRFKRPLSVFMLDIDHFKQVNDTFGHAIGDVVLHQFAQLLKSNIRDIDILGRYGGEEFIVILPETHLSEASAIAERLRTTIYETFQNLYRGSINLSVSIGVAEMNPNIHSLSRLIDRVDDAMYDAKKLGRDRVVVCDD
jgi:diguanylate cyclase (GGDEF)-like protein